jgi:hypothetical protein
MLDLFKQVNLLKYLSFAKVILHIIFLNCFNSHLLASKLVNTKCDFTESTLSNQFHKLVEVQSCWRQFVVFLDVLFDILN